MKNVKLMMLALMMGIAMTGFSQVEMSVHAGLHGTHLQGDGLSNLLGDITDTRTGLHLGVELEYALPSDGFSAVSGINYSRDRFITAVDFPLEFLSIDIPLGVSAETKLKSFSLPLLLKYRHELDNGIGFHLAAGPEVSLTTDADMIIRGKAVIEFRVAKFDIPLNLNYINRWNAYGVVRGGVDFPFANGKLGITGQYRHGFTSITEIPVVELHNYQRNWGGQVSYAWTLGRGR